MQPLISIITPAYNAAQFLQETIHSVQAQTFTNWEMLIVDDGSADGTLAIAQNNALADHRIKVFSQANQGPSVARNVAIENAQGQWLAFLDADDLWEPSKLELQLGVAVKYPDVSLIYTSGSKFTDTNLSAAVKYDIVGGYYNAQEMYRFLYVYNDVPTLSVLARKTLVDQAGPMQPGLLCEDWDLWLRMALCGANFYGLNKRLFYYRKHSSSTSGNALKMQIEQLRVMLRNYRPERFTAMQTRRAFIPLLNYLVMQLTRQGKKAEAKAIIIEVATVLPMFSKIYNLLLLLADKRSIGIFEAVNRVYRKIYPSKKRSR